MRGRTATNFRSTRPAPDEIVVTEVIQGETPMSGHHGGQARADHGPRQRSIAGVGHRPAARASKAPSWPSPIRATRSRSASRPLAAQLGSDLLIDCDCQRHGRARRAFEALKAALGRPRLRRPRDRLFRQERASRRLCRHQPRQFPDDHEHLGLQLRRGRGARADDDEARRLAAHPELLRRRKGHPPLQRDGRRQGRARSAASNISPPTSAPRASASTRSAPARSRRSPRAASATSATS